MIGRTAQREKFLEVVPLSDRQMRVVSTLRDTSTSLTDPKDVELIHQLRLEVLVSLPDLVITEVYGRADEQPYDECALTIAPLQRLRGLSLKRGYRPQVTNRLGGIQGCTHFLTLALELSAANVLSIYLRMRELTPNTAAARADGTWARTGLEVEPGLMNACSALSEDSPVQRRALGQQ